MENIRRYYLAVDIETFGGNPRFHQIICFGAALYDIINDVIVEKKRFHLPIREGMVIEKNCYDEFWEKTMKNEYHEWIAIGEDLAKKGITFENVMDDFITWVRTCCKGKNAKLITDTAGFDIGFLNAYCPVTLPSMNYIFEQGKYNGIRDVHSFAEGVAHFGRKAGLTTCKETWRAAFEAAGGDPNKKFLINANHYPENDAANICLKYGYLLQCLETL